MPILLGALASVLIGCSDFLGRYGTRRSNAVTATSGAMLGGAISGLIALALIPGAFALRDVLLGGASGLLVGFALALLYEAMATSSAALAGPLVALGASLIPLAWDLLLGSPPSGVVLLGVTAALASLLVVMYSPSLIGTRRRGIGLSLVASVLFGISLTMVGEAGDGGGVWAPASQRVVAFVVMLSLATVRHVPRLPPPPLIWPMLISGTCGSLAIVAFALGVQAGDSLSAVAVSASMFPAVSATLAALFDEDTLHWWQFLGILGVIGGISLMAIG